MSAILKSVASLLNIFLLIVFVMVIYAIVFMTLLLSKFHYTCLYNNTKSKFLSYLYIIIMFLFRHISSECKVIYFR